MAVNVLAGSYKALSGQQPWRIGPGSVGDLVEAVRGERVGVIAGQRVRHERVDAAAHRVALS